MRRSARTAGGPPTAARMLAGAARGGGGRGSGGDGGCDGAGVGPEVLAEVVVSRVLAAEGSTGLSHHRLDVAVADLGANGGSAALPNDLGHGLGADAVGQDRRPGLALEHGGGDDRRRGR